MSGASKLTSYLSRPISSDRAVMGWIVTTGVFFSLTQFLGGVVEGDSAQSIYSTWAVQHGQFACIYPPATTFHFPLIALPYAFVAPFWPLLSGGLAAIFQIGHAIPFPSLGAHCANASPAIYHWFVASGSGLPTVRLGYFAWVFLLVGVVAYLRSIGRGKTLWEPFTLLVLAVTPSVFMTLTQYFHPQDIIAVGLSLVGLSFVQRDKWLWAGVFLGLAFTSQQFAILPIALVLVLAHRSKWTKLIVGLTIGVSIIDLPVVIVTSGHGLRTAILGSSRNVANSTGGTVLWEAHLHGMLHFFVARMMPVLAIMALAWWAKRRLDSRVFEPVVFTSLILLAMTVRIFFEVNLFGYYFMAMAIMIILLDIVRGHIRGATMAWLIMVTVAFDPIPFGFVSNDHSLLNATLYRDLPLALIAIVIAILAIGSVRHHFRWYWIVALGATLPVGVQSHSAAFGSPVVPHWIWQIVLVTMAIYLAVGPLRSTPEVLEDELGAQTLGVPFGVLGDASSSLTVGSASSPEERGGIE